MLHIIKQLNEIVEGGCEIHRLKMKQYKLQIGNMDRFIHTYLVSQSDLKGQT